MANVTTKKIIGVLILGVIAFAALFWLSYQGFSAQPLLVNTENQKSITGLPSDVLSEQIGGKYEINGNLYALALEPNLNYSLIPLRDKLGDKEVSWHGVLRGPNSGQSWEKFFTITDPPDPEQSGTRIKYNPVGIFSENGKLYVDIANDRGAGSGEGNLIRFASSDSGNTWSREGCYYFVPEKYYPNFNNFIDGQADTSRISPHLLQATQNCIY